MSRYDLVEGKDPCWFICSCCKKCCYRVPGGCKCGPESLGISTAGYRKSDEGINMYHLIDSIPTRHLCQFCYEKCLNSAKCRVIKEDRARQAIDKSEEKEKQERQKIREKYEREMMKEKEEREMMKGKAERILAVREARRVKKMEKTEKSKRDKRRNAD